jgi:hypothetical protein
VLFRMDFFSFFLSSFSDFRSSLARFSDALRDALSAFLSSSAAGGGGRSEAAEYDAVAEAASDGSDAGRRDGAAAATVNGSLPPVGSVSCPTTRVRALDLSDTPDTLDIPRALDLSDTPDTLDIPDTPDRSDDVVESARDRESESRGPVLGTSRYHDPFFLLRRIDAWMVG